MKYFLLFFFFVFSIYPDRVYQDECNTSVDDNGKPAFITFFGDSLGDFVDMPAYGYLGWDFYLKIHRQEVDWRVQNFAVQGWRTGVVINLLTKCMHPAVRDRFVTSNHVAFEIGGNDMMDWVPMLTVMPWKYFSYVDPLTGKQVMGAVDKIINNARVITRLLRHPQVDKDVLIMGNFPGLAYSPTLGHIGDYADFMKKLSDDTYNKLKDEDTSDIKYVRKFFVKQFEYLMKVFPEYVRNLVMYQILGPLGLVAAPEVFGPEAVDMVPNDPARIGGMSRFDNAPDWFVHWVYTSLNSPSTYLSLGLGLMQSGLEKAAMDERNITRFQEATYTKIVMKNGVIDDSQSEKTNHRQGGDYVHFLPLYHTLIRWRDCVGWGQCWVGEIFYYRDMMPSHVNAWGYLVWSKLLADKVVQLGWDTDTTLRNGGKVVGDTGVTVSIPVADTTPPPPSNLDLLILFCILFGKCW